MSTLELKKKLQAMYPQATKVIVRQYPITYKGSMRGYITVSIYGGGYDYYSAKDKILSVVPEPKKTFVDVSTF